VAALKDAILAEAGETEGSTVGTIEQGYLDRGVFTAVAEAGLQDADNVLRITANTNGAYTLGRAVDGTLSITVTEPGPNPGDEPVPVLLSVTASVTQVGNLVYTWSSDEVVSVDTAGRDEGLLVREGAILTFDGAEVPADVLATMPTDSTPGDPAVAAYTDRIDQTIVNAGPGWAEDGTQLNYYGDAPQIGAMDGPGGAFNGAGVGQSYANPADGATHTEGSAQDAVASGEDGDDGFRGDAARIGENDGDDGSFNGQGVQQTHTNPDGWYTAIPGSPAWGERDDGDNSDLYGSNAGYYADDGLHTTYHLPLHRARRGRLHGRHRQRRHRQRRRGRGQQRRGRGRGRVPGRLRALRLGQRQHTPRDAGQRRAGRDPQLPDGSRLHRAGGGAAGEHRGRWCPGHRGRRRRALRPRRQRVRSGRLLVQHPRRRGPG